MAPVMAPASVYLHIPFCAHKCYYCDFNTYVMQGQIIEDYLQAMEREMREWVQACPPGRIDTIFIGGGTPTLLDPRQLERLLAAIRQHFPDWSGELEFTVEANPGTTDEDKLRVLREGGVNRLSIGAQSFDDALLRRIGRIHQADDVRKSLEMARAAGFDNLSIDLMFGLPGQNLKLFQEDLRQALSFGLEHYSVYSLIVEENTLFHTLYEKGQLALPDEDEELSMYLACIDLMEAHGYLHYEISNFARQGYASRHNQTYWRNEEYYGLGAGAHGHVQGVRYENVKGVGDYIRAVNSGRGAVFHRHRVSETEAMEETMMVGLRMMEGISYQRFFQRHGRDMLEVYGPVIQRLSQLGLIRQEADRIRLTRRGLLYGNEVFAAFLGESA